MKGRTSLTKNWPGGRKKATIVTPTKDNKGSVPTWNKITAGMKRPYWPEADNNNEIRPNISTTNNTNDGLPINDAISE